MAVETARVALIGTNADGQDCVAVLVLDIDRHQFFPHEFAKYVERVQCDSLIVSRPPSQMVWLRDIHCAYSDGSIMRWIAAPGEEILVDGRPTQVKWPVDNALVDALLNRESS